MNDCRLILIVPPQRGLMEGFSSGLISIANYVQAREPNLEIQLLDLSLEPLCALPAIASRALTSPPKLNIVGVTTTTASYQSALAVTKAFKVAQCSSLTLLGGHHASSQDEVILNNQPAVDAVARGEGEITVLELSRNFPNLHVVPGLSFRTPFGVQRNPEGALLTAEELDDLRPSFNTVSIRSMPGKFGHATYVSARGCPLKCHFCSVANQSIRAKSVSAVLRDLRHLIRDLGHRRLALEDNFFAHSPSRTLNLCAALRELQSESPFVWDCQTRVESMCNPELVGAMDAAGCEAAYLGVEACVPRQLLYLGKTEQPDSYLRRLEQVAVPLLLSSRISVYLNLQVGLPGETEAERATTLTLLRKLGTSARNRGKRITVFPQLHVIYPGTRHFQEYLSKNAFGDRGASVFEAFTKWEVEQEPVLQWLGEHFAHGVGGVPIGMLSTSALQKGEFQVIPKAVTEISSFLERLADIPGITVFRYGQYLARVEEPICHAEEDVA